MSMYNVEDTEKETSDVADKELTAAVIREWKFKKKKRKLQTHISMTLLQQCFTV